MSVTTERYEAIVSKIEGFDDEDEKRGVIEVICPGLMADDETPLPVLCGPVHDWGWFYVPDVGEAVEIEVVTSSDRDEVWGQQTLEALAPTWRGKRQHTDIEPDGDDPRPIHDDYVATNYGKRRGFSTPFGHVLLFDDTPDDQRIYITHMAEQLEPGEAPDPEKFTRIEIEPDGSLIVSFLNKHKLHFTTEQGNLKVSLDGVNPDDDHKHTLEFDAETPKLVVSLAEEDSVLTFDGGVPSLEVKMGAENHVIKLEDGALNVKTAGGSAMKMTADDADTTTVFGDGAVSAAIAEHLEEYLNDTLIPEIAAMHDDHAHPLPQAPILIPGPPVPCIPGGPPGVDTPIVPASLTNYAANITSGHLVFPDG